MMEFLLVSNRHGLMPLAHRLNLAGEKTNLVVWRNRFEKAWSGNLEPVLRGSKGEIQHETLGVLREQVEAGGVTLLTDVPLEKMGITPAESEGLIYGSTTGGKKPVSIIQVGGWFDGDKVLAPHLLVVDWGAWPGGLGPMVEGGLTLVLPSGSYMEYLENQIDDLRQGMSAVGFRGLFSVGLNPSEDGYVEFDGLQCGWNSLHGYAFLSELENFAQLLKGEEEPRFTGGVKFVTVIPVTLPPWPNQGKAAEVAVDGLTPTLMGKAFWMDVCMNGENGGLQTAGLDGYVAIARGAAGSSELARSRALEIALRIQMPEKQLRSDAGQNVPVALATLEQQYDIVL